MIICNQLHLTNRAIVLMIIVFANGPGNWCSIPSRVIPKTQKWFLRLPCLTQHYKVRIKGKIEQSRERSSVLPYTSVVAIEKGAFGLPWTKVTNLTYFMSYLHLIIWINYSKYQAFTRPSGVVDNVLDCDIVVSEIEFQPCYYVHFPTNTCERGMNPLIPLAVYCSSTRMALA